MTLLALVLAVVIQLPGVTGGKLRARAFFDANNVKVGDPLTLTVDFLGDADFQSLHPPALAPRVPRGDWKIYDESAKTDTYRDARRLTYRVRPMRKGVLWFPALEFSYESPEGMRRTVRANAIPVHVKTGSQVVVGGMDEVSRMPDPGGLVTETSFALSDDDRFAWRKACASPTAAAFARFDFPEARLNEARCAVLEGNWARALKIYAALEWKIGQTPGIERGMVAALARRYDNPQAELPVWRQIGRPVLRYAWGGRLALAVGAVAGLAAVLYLIGRIIRLIACLAAVLTVLLPAEGYAQGIFQQLEEQMQMMRQQMQRSVGAGFVNERQEPVEVRVSVEMSRKDVRVGDDFEFIILLEAPKTCSIGQIRITPSERFGMSFTGQARNLPDEESEDPSNAVRRISVPVRYDVPFKSDIFFAVDGMVSRREDRNRRGGFFSFTSSTSFQSRSKPITVEVKPLPTDGQPEDYSGIVSADLALREYIDLKRVETNDVIQITYEMRADGFVPPDFMPQGAAFEINRDEARGVVSYRRFFIADGARTTPQLEISYYDPESRSYRRAACGGHRIEYR